MNQCISLTHTSDAQKTKQTTDTQNVKTAKQKNRPILDSSI